MGGCPRGRRPASLVCCLLCAYLSTYLLSNMLLRVRDPEFIPCSVHKWGISNDAGGSLAFLGGVLLHRKSLGHPAKAQNLEILKLGFHPHAKPTCPGGGSLNCRSQSIATMQTQALRQTQAPRGAIGRGPPPPLTRGALARPGVGGRRGALRAGRSEMGEEPLSCYPISYLPPLPNCRGKNKTCLAST